MKTSIHARLAALVLALVLVCSLGVPASAAQFTDVPETHWAYNDIMECANQGIVTGFADGSFLPNETVTSVQFIVMLTRTFYAQEVAAVSAPAGSAWYYAYTKAASDLDLLKNLEAADINDTKGMTRYNMAIVLFNTLVANTKSINTTKMQEAMKAITDYDSIPAANRISVVNCYAQNIITGMSDGSFSGEESMTRAQACTVIIRMRNLIQGTQPAAPTTPAQPSTPATPEQPAQPAAPAGTGKLANGQDATPENVSKMLDQLKTQYPDGMIWGDIGSSNNNYYANGGQMGSDIRTLKNQTQNPIGAIDLNYGCGGFMSVISDSIFGTTGAPCREVTDINDLRPGDILLAYDKTGQLRHGCIVLSVDEVQANEVLGGYSYIVITADGNINPDANGLNGKIKWGIWGSIWNGFGASNYTDILGRYYRAFTRYPD